MTSPASPEAGIDEVTQVVRPQQAPSAPAPTAKEQWKLRSPVGLVYDFPDLQALKSWLSSRDSVDGMSASRDGGVSWELLTAFPELRSALPKAARLALSRSEPAVGTAQTTLLTAPTDPAPRPSPPAPRPSMSGSPPAVPPEPLPASKHPSASYAMTPAANSPAQRDMLTPGSLPPPTASPTPAAETSGPKRPPARPSIRSGGFPSIGGAPRSARSAGSSAAARSGGRVGRAPVVGRRGASARRRPRPVRRRAGLGTWLGVALTGAVLVAAVLQLSGLFDVAEALGMRSHSEATEVPADPSTEPVAPIRAADSDRGTVPEAGPEPSAGRDTPASATELLDQRRQGVNPHASRIAMLTSQAREVARDGRIEEAIDLVNNALQFDRSNADTVCLLADLQRRAGALIEADALDERCRALGTPGNGPVTEP